MKCQARHRVTIVAAILLAIAGTTAVEAQPEHRLKFSVTYEASVADAFTGRVYVMLSASAEREPRLGPSWFNPQPFFAVDVEDWKPGAPLIFDDSAVSFPDRPSTLVNGEWSIQAVMRRNLDSPFIAFAEGTAYGEAIRKETNGQFGGTIELVIDRVIGHRPDPDWPGVEVVRVPSKLLSDFYGREIVMEAAVWLPGDFDESGSTRYPALYLIPGFGGDHLQALMLARRASSEIRGIVKIGLNAQCLNGHHVFADSQNNGPRGQALVTELIPHLEQKFNLVSAPTARFLTGVSSGGWSSLWLQITYPDSFGGVWALAPDPVDFRAFQLVDIYEPGANVFVNDDGERIPIARRRGEAVQWYDKFAAMETVIGPGGQLHSFDAAFSPRGPDGQPQQMFDRTTGDVNPQVAEAWKRYDIRLYLQDNWQELAPKLAGKIHIIGAANDNFFLEEAVRLLKASLKELGSDAKIVVLDHKNHMNLADRGVMQGIDHDVLHIYQRHHGDVSSPRKPSTRPAG